MLERVCLGMSMRTFVIWVIATFFAFFQFFLQTAAGVIGTEWMRDFHLNKVELGSLSSAFFYTYAFMQIPVGMLFDRYSPRYILTLAAFILTLGCWWLAYTDQYQTAFYARLLMGVGSSFGFIGMLQVCATYFSPKRFAFMVGVSEGVTMLAVTSSIILLTWIVSHYSWRVALAGSGVITLLLSITIFILLRDDQPRTSSVRLSWSFSQIVLQLKTIFTDRQVILCSLYGFFMFSIVNAFTSLWGIPFLITTYSFSKQLAANMVAVVFIGIAIGGPLSGWISKLMSQHRVILIVAAILGMIVMSVIIFVPHLPQSILFILFFLIGLFCAGYVQCFAVIKDSVELNIRATALATANMIIMLGAPILQLLIGWLLQNHCFGIMSEMDSAYRLSLGLLPLGMFIAIFLAYKVQEPEAVRS